MNIRKVLHRDGKTTVIGESQNVNDMETCALRGCTDAPKPPFTKALEAVTKDVLKAIGIQGKGFEVAFSVTGVTIDKEKSSGRRGVSFRTTLETPMGKQNAGLPRMTERLEDETGPRVLSDMAMKHVEKLLEEAKAYYAGDRISEQVDAFPDAADGGS